MATSEERETAFRDVITRGYAAGEPSVVLGAGMLDGTVLPDARISLSLRMANRHGLIAGATGTGKTKTLQVIAGQLSDAGVPVFVADVKGDLTGLAAPGNAGDPQLHARAQSLGWDYRPNAHPVEFLSLSGALGAPLRASVHSFGPLLLGKVLDLNQTQTSVLSLIFKYCDDNALPLLDLPDLTTTLKYLASDEGKPILDEYGGMSKATVGVILRAVVTLEQEGADLFFGEPAFEVADLLRQTPDGRGVISVLELRDVMDKPRLFSTFMLWMLAQLYETLPEVGDLPQPKLCFFFDEAHLLFDDASEALLDQVELTVRLIRSKGIGVYFVTHSPTDVPPSVLSQLGNRVQHALRAFTPDDAENLRKTVRTFPMSEYYEVGEVLTSLGIGEALVTVLGPTGVPTPLAATRILPPDSLMAALPPQRFEELVAVGQLGAKYRAMIDRDSAHEMITRRIAAARSVATGAHVPPTTSAGLNQMTAAQQRRELARQEREMERQRREAERYARDMERAAARRDAAQRREQERTLREGSRLFRTVFGAFFGSAGGRRRRRR